MIRAVKQGMNWMTIEINSIEDDAENIEEFVGVGDPVVLVQDIEELKELLDLEDFEITQY